MAEIDPAGREILTWELFGVATRELASRIAADGFRPDMVLPIARGGLTVAGALAYALAVKTSIITPEYVWAQTERWIDFPWSSQVSVVESAGPDARGE
jgi:hypothetical protein